MNAKLTAVLFGILLLRSGTVLGQTTWTVDNDGPADFFTIGNALAASVSGDTILVMAGDYYENLSLDASKSVNIIGEGSDVTFLIGSGTGSVVSMVDVVNAELSGLRVSNSGASSGDAGIRISGGSPLIRNNRIVNNPENGILLVEGSTAVIQNNTLTGNGTEDGYVDYAICCVRANPIIVGNRIVDNPEVGLYVAWVESSDTKIINNTIANNGSRGIWCHSEASVLIKNNVIVSNNTGISASGSSAPVILHNDVWNNVWLDYDPQSGGVSAPGPGDISADTLLDADYLLQAGSPCIDAGENATPELPAVDIDGDARILDGDGDAVPVVDMGADEYVAAPSGPCVAASTVASDPTGTGDRANGLALLLAPLSALLVLRARRTRPSPPNPSPPDEHQGQGKM